MKLIILTVLLGAALPSCLPAALVNYGTYLYENGNVQSQFVNYADTRVYASADNQGFVSASLNNGSLRLLIGSAGVVTIGAGAQALLYDTITFVGSDFQGAFGANYLLNLKAHYTGSFSKSGTIDSGGTGGRIQVYAGSTQVDSSVFTDGNSLTNFLFINGPTPLCSQGVNGPDLTTFQGAFAFDVSCSVNVSAANPTVRIFMNLPAFINVSSPTSFTLDISHTATLSLGDLGGRTVISASGVLPGTQSATPEPNMALLTGFGIGALLIVRAARSKAGALKYRNADRISWGHHGASGTVARR